MANVDRKGKTIDRSTKWPADVYNESGLWSRQRLGRNGDSEDGDSEDELRYPDEVEAEPIQEQEHRDRPTSNYPTTASLPNWEHQPATSAETSYPSDSPQVQSTVSDDSSYGRATTDPYSSYWTSRGSVYTTYQAPSWNFSGDSTSKPGRHSVYHTTDNSGYPQAPSWNFSGDSASKPGTHSVYHTTDHSAYSDTNQYVALGSGDEPPVETITGGLDSFSFQESANPSHEGLHRKIPNTETLDARYKRIESRKSKNFWVAGRVFAVLWTEPSARDSNKTRSQSPSSTTSNISTVYMNGSVFSEIRRFVVLQVNYGNCICSPIHTYGGQATLKPNLPDRLQHAIIYTTKTPPDEFWYTAADGTIVTEDLSKDPIKVRSEQRGVEGELGTKSRINFTKLYTVEQQLKVLNIGMVEDVGQLLQNSMLKPRNTPPERPRRTTDGGKRNRRRKESTMEPGSQDGPQANS